jgi:hypothetical protein
VIALAGSASAASVTAPDTPEGYYNKVSLYGHQVGVQMFQIEPTDVEKDDKGNIKVTIRGTRNGDDVTVKFFTLLEDCKSYAADKSPQQAPSSDIN